MVVLMAIVILVLMLIVILVLVVMLVVILAMVVLLVMTIMVVVVTLTVINVICSLKMMPSLDIYSFGMVLLFLFSGQNWWTGSAPRSPNIADRETQVQTMLTNMEGRLVLEKIAQQIRKMLDPNPKCRPRQASDCSFELRQSYHER